MDLFDLLDLYYPTLRSLYLTKTAQADWVLLTVGGPASTRGGRRWWGDPFLPGHPNAGPLAGKLVSTYFAPCLN